MRKYLFLFLFFLPLVLYSQTLKGYGIKFNFTTSQYGWTNPDTGLTHFYPHNPDIGTLGFGVYGEFFNKKYFSLMTNLYYRTREFTFDYDKYDINGNKAGEDNVKNSLSFFSFSVTPKIKADYKRLSVYVFGGPRFDFIFRKNIDKDFQNAFNNSESVLFGLSAGFGTSINVTKEMNFLLDFYYNPDINNTIKSSTGHVRNTEFGIIFGMGIYNSKSK